MKKRLLSALLAFCMVLTLLPGTALAAGELPPKDTMYWNNRNMQVAIGFVRSILTNPASSDIILVYYQAEGCVNSANYVPQYAAFADTSKLRMYGYAYDRNAQAGQEGYSLPASEMQALLGKTSYTFPVVIAYNSETKAYRAKDAVLGLDALKALLADCGLYTPSENPGPSIDLINDASISTQTWEVLRLVNQHRMGMGLKPLSTFGDLQKVANQRAYEIYVDYRPDHTRPNGSICWTAYDDYGVRYNLVAENIASGQRDAADVMNSWLNSPGHRQNIEKTGVTHMGAGFYNGPNPSGYANNWTQDFAASMYCKHTNLRLSKTSIPGNPGTDLETLLKNADITVTLNCQQYGESKMPLIAAMCSGYDKNSAATQTVTVSCDGMTAALVISGSACPSHDFGSGVVTTEPTCTEAGVRTYTCSKCGETRTEAIPAKGHSFDSGVVTKEPTCTEAGVRTYTCSACGETKTESIPAKGHSFDSGVVTKEPTCTEAGVRTYTCPKCGETKTEAISAKGHNYQTTENGDRVCTVCGHTIPAASVTVEDRLDEALAASTPQEVREILNQLDRDELVKVLTDSLYSKIEALEARINGSAAVDAAGSGISGAKIVGAKLNADYDSQVTLKISQPEDASIPTPDPSAANAFRFSMDLLDGDGRELPVKVPVKITLPIPVSNLDAKSFKLWHVRGGSPELVQTALRQTGSQWYATFTIDSFSDFIMTYQTVSTPPVDPGIPGGSGGSSVQPTLYAVTAPAAAHGTVVLSSNAALEGFRVTVTTAADEGYQLETLSVRDSSGKELALKDLGRGVYAFYMPACKVVVEAVFAPVSQEPAPGPETETTPETTPAPESLPFVDVAGDAWYYSDVCRVYENGLMSGDGSETVFNPGGGMTRAMLWTVLARLDGADTAGGSPWYEPARAWAMAEGVSDGEAPQDLITREQLVTMLWRYLKAPAGEAGLDAFTDAASVSGWAAEAVSWAVSAGLLGGADGRLNPTGTAVRAEVAAILSRFIQSESSAN